jgi:Aspartyl protease
MLQLIFPIAPSGLLVPVFVGLDSRSMIARLNANLPVPAPLMLQGIIDTGSDVTALRSSILQKLGVSTGQKKTAQTASGPISVNLVEISLSIVGPIRAASPMFSDPNVLAMELP